MNFLTLRKRLIAAYESTPVGGRVDHFDGWRDRLGAENDGEPAYDHGDTVQEYYDLCTAFMTFGWNESLHFAPLTPAESLQESIDRHQLLMIDKLDLHAGMKVIDVGCGIGGPMRRVARETQVNVVGINNSEVQLRTARQLNAESELGDLVDCVQCNFMDMSIFEEGTFDRGYAIESTCHAHDKEGAFAEIFRVLKPGSLLWGQEMCLTDEFDPNDEEHLSIKQDLMHGIALKDIATMDSVVQTLEKVGFEVLEARDRNVQEGPSLPWYHPMSSNYGKLGFSFRATRLGRRTYLGLVKLSEHLGVLPKGSSQVVKLMDGTALAYVSGGVSGIFSPLFCFVARKPGRSRHLQTSSSCT